jgi:hypothetical protein
MTRMSLLQGWPLLSSRPSGLGKFFAGCDRDIENVPAAGYGSDDGLRALPESTPDLDQALHK